MVEEKPVVAIVDDDEMVSEATRELVATFGLQARSFLSAEAFLKSSVVERTSCIVADMHMPGMDGLKLQGKLIELGYRIPIIFITAFPDDHIRKRALESGAICYLTKPFDPETLISCIRSAIKLSGKGADSKR
jgi:FixJ family two-component response regulator